TTAADLSSTFGPRLKASEGFRYDFHRGIDIPARIGTPVRAVAAGEVRIAGLHPTYEDALVQIRHTRGGATTCADSPNGCFYSNYMHLSHWTVAEGDRVEQGDVIGYTGTSKSEFEHLHFEIRDGGIYQQNAIHPLRMLPHDEAVDLSATVEANVAADEHGFAAEVNVLDPHGALDVTAVRVRLLDRDSHELRDERTFEMETWNREWTHRESDWPALDCPKHAEHPREMHYDPNVHTDNPSFGGLEIQPSKFNAESDSYGLAIRFEAMSTPTYDDSIALEVEVENTRGELVVHHVEP
ncbi:MAG: M23 family metallopeptidase, partial [Myxococcales bacterium]|nr:M23 family metallopeptidase [Myxococcales bacterium]